MQDEDFDGSGRDEAIIDFGADYGVWVLENSLGGYPLHSTSPAVMVTGDLDGF